MCSTEHFKTHSPKLEFHSKISINSLRNMQSNAYDERFSCNPLILKKSVDATYSTHYSQKFLFRILMSGVINMTHKCRYSSHFTLFNLTYDDTKSFIDSFISQPSQIFYWQLKGIQNSTNPKMSKRKLLPVLHCLRDTCQGHSP